MKNYSRFLSFRRNLCFAIFSLFFVLACKEKNTGKSVAEVSPYEVFFKQLKINNLSDTILVQNSTKIFGCGAASVEYEEELRKKGIDKFYEKYGNMLDQNNSKFITLFEKKNNIKVLWINRGNEGELFQLEDSILCQNTKLQSRLLKEKTFIAFEDSPNSIDSLKIQTTVNYQTKNKIILKTCDLSKVQNSWKIDKETEEEIKQDL